MRRGGRKRNSFSKEGVISPPLGGVRGDFSPLL